MGGADTNWKDVVIKEIVPNTQADIDGQLRPGDHILKVSILCKLLTMSILTKLSLKYLNNTNLYSSHIHNVPLQVILCICYKIIVYM